MKSIMFDRDDLILQSFQKRLVIDSDTDTEIPTDSGHFDRHETLKGNDEVKRSQFREKIKSILENYEDIKINPYKRRILQGIKSSLFVI